LRRRRSASPQNHQPRQNSAVTAGRRLLCGETEISDRLISSWKGVFGLTGWVRNLLTRDREQHQVARTFKSARRVTPVMTCASMMYCKSVFGVPKARRSEPHSLLNSGSSGCQHLAALNRIWRVHGVGVRALASACEGIARQLEAEATSGHSSCLRMTFFAIREDMV